ncbi:lysophospholipase L1-like esterase [Tumebacillus sp. BK434]|uniref:SGNH/GDSL hydrolase family protein n=1 Tax=Tumebacillus sp. BK434 TaxID=2512169 RepID=UPI0010EA1652|nr:SGNH/GDSL hydrolase family protein [Tumebacillus sp. BK434]TCP53867.1 lysophospholipase L1-like esterase [Tumebacillus sp. BK434]
MILYTAMGDSITAGLNASAPSLAYPSCIMRSLKERGKEAKLGVIAQNGWTSSALRCVAPEAAGLLHNSTTITIWIGGNDLLQAAAGIVVGGRPVQTAIAGRLASYSSNMERIVASVRQHSKACIILCTQYNPFPNSPVAVEGVAALNKSTADSAKRLGTELAPVHEWFEGSQPALIFGYRNGRIEDALRPFRRPIHPNNAGHAMIARHLASYIR